MISFDLPDDLIEIGADVVRNVFPDMPQDKLDTAAKHAFMSMLSYTQNAEVSFIEDDGKSYVWPHDAKSPVFVIPYKRPQE